MRCNGCGPRRAGVAVLLAVFLLVLLVQHRTAEKGGRLDAEALWTRLLPTLPDADLAFVAPDAAGRLPRPRAAAAGRLPRPRAAAAGATTAASTAATAGRGWAQYAVLAPQWYDDLAAPVQPLSPAEAALLVDSNFSTAKTAWLREDDGLRAVATRSTFKTQRIDRDDTEVAALSATYCGHCRTYVGGVPNRGARIGHYFSHWLAIVTYARRLNATLLYHPLLPNQAEHQLFERYFGFGYPEPFRLFDACVRGIVGEACDVFLPCLKVVTAPVAECDTVYALPDDRYPPSEDRTEFAIHLGELRRRFHRARRLDPIHLAFSEDSINVAIHVRRGDVAKNPELRDRYTNDTTYVTILRTLATLLEGHPIVGRALRGRMRVHVFSQGQKTDFPDLLPLEAEGWLEFHLDTSVISTLFHLTMADVLVSAKSGFSFTAAALREPWQPTLYPPKLSMNLPGWVQYDDTTGRLDTEQMARMLDVFLASQHRRALVFNALRRS